MRNRDREDSRYIVWREYEGLEELSRVTCGEANRKHGMASVFRDGACIDAAWQGFRTLRDWRRWYEAGWPEGVRKVREALRDIHVPAAMTVRRRAQWADDGDELAMERIYQGQPESAWRRIAPRTVAGPRHVRIRVDVSASAATPANAFFWPGAAALALSDALENAGYSTEILACASTHGAYEGSNRDAHVEVKVKDHRERLNLSRLAAILCHVGTLRVGLFAALLSPERKTTGGLGRPIHPDPMPGEEQGDIVLRCWNKVDANAQLRKAVAKLNTLSETT